MIPCDPMVLGLYGFLAGIGVGAGCGVSATVAMIRAAPPAAFTEGRR